MNWKSGISCYKFGHHHVLYSEALDVCRRDNAHLLAIDDENEYDFINNYLIQSGKYKGLLFA